MDFLASALPFIGIALLFWLLLVRPQARRQRELRAMQASLSVGDEVVLTSGIHGVLREVGDQINDRVDDQVTEVVGVEVAPGVTIRVARGAIGALVRPETHTTEDQPEPGEEGNE